jgi:hypothetical protein
LLSSISLIRGGGRRKRRRRRRRRRREVYWKLQRPFVGMDRCPCYSLTTADRTNLDYNLDVLLAKPSLI